MRQNISSAVNRKIVFCALFAALLACAAAGLWILWPGWQERFLWGCCLLVCACQAKQDFESLTVSDGPTVLLALCAAAVRTLSGTAFDGLLGLIPGACLAPFAFLALIGWGDVLLVMSVGAALGLRWGLTALGIGCFVAGLAAGIGLLTGKVRHGQVWPFAPVLFLGVFLAVFIPAVSF